MRREIAVELVRTDTALAALRAANSGATAIEYALIVGLVSLSILIWAMSIGTSVSGFLTAVANGL